VIDEGVKDSELVAQIAKMVQRAAGGPVEFNTERYYRPHYDHIRGQENSFPPGTNVSHEVTLSSLCALGPGTFAHIPMIDFLTPDLELARSVMLTQCRSHPWLLVSSGKSFHAYVGALLPFVAITRWLGSLLSIKAVEQTIDHRWVGHSLRRQAMQLRVTNLTGYYKVLPTVVHEHIPKEPSGQLPLPGSEPVESDVLTPRLEQVVGFFR